MTKQNAYDRHIAYQDKTKVVARGMCWIATKTMLVIYLTNGFLIFPLRQEKT